MPRSRRKACALRWVPQVINILHRDKKYRGVSKIADAVDEAVRWNA